MSMTFEIEIDREDDRRWIAEVPAPAGGAPAIVVRDTPPERDDESASGTTASGMARAGV